MRFEAPIFFLLLVPTFWIAWQSFRHGDGVRRILFPLGNRQMNWPRQDTLLRKLIPAVLSFIGLTALIIAIARPQTGTSETKNLTEGIDIMIALDVSKSMLIEDSNDLDRLTAAKETVKRFISGRSDDRIGFLMFGGESITLCPPTLDYDMLLGSVDSANTDQLKDGTAIGVAIGSAVNRLKNSKAKSKVIILITDGDNNMGSITPLTAGDIAKSYGIKVYSIALGHDGMARLPVVDMDIFGRRVKRYEMVPSSVNPELLMHVSETTGGKFFRAEDQTALKNVFAEINQLEKSKHEKRERMRWNEHFQIFLSLGLLVLCLDQILRRTWLRILPT
jgi:Ca-activated chloride channel family protein